MAKKRHQLIGLGGAFDHFHRGHEHFIRYAAQFAEKLVIGVTVPSMNKHKPYFDLIQPLKVRKQHVGNFCQKSGISCDVIDLRDPYGPPIERETKIQALCVTTETVQGGEKINEIRMAAQVRPLPIYICDLLTDETGRELHADDIRAGQVNREGVVYLSHFIEDVHLTENQKQHLRRPLGTIVEQPSEARPGTLTMVIGDTTLEKFLVNEWAFDLAVYDKQQQREAIPSVHIDEIEPKIKTTNQAGGISLQLIKDLQLALKNRAHYVFVDGEEDLATAALILIVPLGTHLYYGQPGEGLVEVVVSEQLKDKIFHILFA